MILHSVRVENYKGIRGPWEAKFDVNSPNLFEGPNGAGKSTLVEAVQCCLAESHNTAGVTAEQMRPRGTALTPSICVVFSQAGSVYRVAKTFLDSPKATLEKRRADGAFDTIAKGKAADEQVRELLRSHATKAKDRPGERFGLFSILCGAQGAQSLPDLSGNVLSDIRAMLGAQVAAGGSAFERLVAKKYADVWTPGGKPKRGKLTDTQAKLAAARADLQSCEDRIAQVAGHEAAARDQRTRAQAACALIQNARAEYDAVQSVAEQVLALRSRRAPASSRLEAASAVYKQHRCELDQILALSRTKQSCQEAQAGLAVDEETARIQRDASARQAQDAQDAWEAAARPNPELQSIEQRIERGGAFLQVNGELENLRVRIGRAELAAADGAAIERDIANLDAPDPGQWSAIRAMARELEEATIHVDALALRLDIAAETDLVADVIGGTPAGVTRIAAGQSIEIRGDGGLTVALPGIATLRFSGPSGDAAQWRSKQAQADATLRSFTEAFGVANWSELETRVNQRERLAIDLVHAKAELAAALAGDSLDELTERSARLSGARAELLLFEPSWGAQPPDLEALRAAAAALQAESDATQQQARSAWDAARQHCSDAADALTAATMERSLNDSLLAQAVQSLAPLEADGLTLADRHERLAHCRKECETAADALREIDAALGAFPPDAPEQAEKIRRKIGELELECQAARELYQQEESAVRAILLQGPYTSLASAEEQVRQLEHDEAAETLRLDAIKRLKLAVDAAKEKALAGIAEPVEERATALLARISGRPLARVRLGGGMAVDSVQPEGCGDPAAVDEMSAGEQEQIYFATRLALAEVLAGGERQVLVLDDPLVNTDADRMARALDLIGEQRQRFQFVILTCHPGRYLELANAVSTPVGQSASAVAAGEIRT